MKLTPLTTSWLLVTLAALCVLTGTAHGVVTAVAVVLVVVLRGVARRHLDTRRVCMSHPALGTTSLPATAPTWKAHTT